MSRTAYLRNWAHFGRLKLVKDLGGECVFCGKKKTLELDHINGRTWNARDKSRWMRLVIHRREARAGLLQVLCRKCNKKKG